MARQFRNQGIYVYSKQLLHRFSEMAKGNSLEIRPFTNAAMSNDANDLQASDGLSPVPSRLMKYHHPWRIGGASIAARLNEADVLFSPSGLLVPIKGLVPLVTTIHDITPVVAPSYFGKVSRMMSFYLRASARMSDCVITDSAFSKRDLVETFRLPHSKIFVVHLGYDKEIFNDSEPDLEAQQKLFQKIGLTKPFIFHHGTIQPRKNLARLIEAFRLLTSRNPYLDLDLVLAGSLGWMFQDVLLAAENRSRRGRVILPGALSDEEIAMMVKGSSLVVVPSLYEGFCLPMIEAMACGVPTIASNTSCLPEVSGGVLRYFDPLSVENMADSIEQVLEDAELRRQLGQEGQKRAEGFSWEKCARETLDLVVRTQEELSQ